MQARVDDRSRPQLSAGRKSITTTGVTRECADSVRVGKSSSSKRVTSPSGLLHPKTKGVIKSAVRRTTISATTQVTEPSTSGDAKVNGVTKPKQSNIGKSSLAKLGGRTKSMSPSSATKGSCAGTQGNQNVVLLRYTSGTGTMFGLFGSQGQEEKEGKLKTITKVTSPMKEGAESQVKDERVSISSRGSDTKRESNNNLGQGDKKEQRSKTLAPSNDKASRANHTLSKPKANGLDPKVKVPKIIKDGIIPHNIREDDSGYHSRENSLEKPWSNKHKRCILNERWSPEESTVHNREGLVDEIPRQRRKEMCPPRRSKLKGGHTRDNSSDRSDCSSSQRSSPICTSPNTFDKQDTSREGSGKLVLEKGEKLVTPNTKPEFCDERSEGLKRDQVTVIVTNDDMGDTPKPHPRHHRSKSRSRSPNLKQSSIDETQEDEEEGVGEAEGDTKNPWLKKSLTCSALLAPGHTVSSEELLNSNSIEPGGTSGEDLQVTAIVHSEPSHSSVAMGDSKRDMKHSNVKSSSRTTTSSPVLEVLAQGLIEFGDSPARKTKTFLHKINGWIQDHAIRAQHQLEQKYEAKKDSKHSKRFKLPHQHSAPEEMSSHPSMVKTPPSSSPLHKAEPAHSSAKKLPKQMSLDSAKSAEVKPSVRQTGKSRSQPIAVAIPTPPSVAGPCISPHESQGFVSPEEEEFIDVCDEALMYEQRAKEREASDSDRTGHRKTARDVKRSRSFKDIFRGRSKSRGRDRDREREREHERQRKIVDSYDLRVERVDLRTRFGLPPLHNKIGDRTVRKAVLFPHLVNSYLLYVCLLSQAFWPVS